MPELVSGGPKIPVDLMTRADGGDVVFFCGAGISMGHGSKLPGFEELVDYIYADNKMKPDAVEREALHLDQPNKNLRRPLFDKALGLLERSSRLGHQALRKTVIKRLSKRRTGALNVHKALLDLSRTEQGIRLITTNFDRRFVQADRSIRNVDAAPKMPVPKRHNWASLVHLHGRIVPGRDGSNLVLTAADFGRAYLTDRWASRFVTELFREFTVIFVGYSVSDPVMGYLVDALAAERDQGARIEKAYAFADHDGSPDGIKRARDGWLAKNVAPILYDRANGHSLLEETLIEWARIRSDPFHARSQVALNDITKMPAGPNDPVVERVLWALDDSVAAEALADAPAIMDEDDYPKLEQWLEIFAQRGLLQCVAVEMKPGGTEGPALARLVDSGFEARNPQNVDRTRMHLARWIACHLHVPQVLAWTLRMGGHLHPELRTRVQIRLSEPHAYIPPKLRLLWTVLSNKEPEDNRKYLWSAELYGRARSDTEHRQLEDDAIESMSPRLVVLDGPTARLKFEQYVDRKGGPIPPIDSCGHLKVAISDGDSRHQVHKILENESVLSRHAETLTGYLDQALVLAEEDDDVYSDSSLYRPSIAAHSQNRHHDPEGLNHLIDLVRDAYLGLAKGDRARAANLLNRWSLSRQPLLRRLVLHAITEDPTSNIQLAKKILVSGRRPGIWDIELRREVLRFFRLAGSRLPRTVRTEIVNATLAGPRVRPRKPDPRYDVSTPE